MTKTIQRPSSWTLISAAPRSSVLKNMFFAVVLFFGIGTTAFAQTLDWVNGIGGGIGINPGNRITFDTDGNVYVIGKFIGTQDFDPGPDTANLISTDYDIFFAKYNSSGNYIWAKSIGGGYIGSVDDCSIDLDNAGHIYIAGYFTNTADFDPSSNNADIVSNGSADIFFAKYDTAGNYIWAKSVGGVGTDIPSELIVDDSAIYITGSFSNGTTVDFDPGPNNTIITAYGTTPDIFFAKYDTAGNYIWAKSVGSGNTEYAYGIDLDGSGNVYLIGSFQATADFDPGPGVANLTSHGGWDIFIAKYDALGNYIWANNIGSSTNDYGYRIRANLVGDIYVTGDFNITADFDPGPGVANLTAVSSSDIFIAKYDALGNYIWANNIGIGTKGRNLILDNLGNVYLTGGLFAKYDTSGNCAWIKSTGGICNDIAVDDFGNIYITGYYSNTANFYGTTITNIGGGAYETFVLKLMQRGIKVFVYNDVNQNCIKDGSDYGLFEQTLVINPGNDSVKTNQLGIYCFDYLSSGNYTVTISPNNLWLSTCPVTQSFTITNLDTIANVHHFGLVYNQAPIQGIVYNDFNQNCVKDTNEIGLPGQTLIINPGGYVTQTDQSGVYFLDSLPLGNYTVTIDTTNHLWLSTCPVTQSFMVSNLNQLTQAPAFGLVSTQPCSDPDISIIAPTLRIGMSGNIYVTACNQLTATGALNSAYAEVQLPSFIMLQSATLPYTSLGGNLYRFDLGNLNPGQCVSWTISAYVDLAAMQNQTLCMEATLYPIQSCIYTYDTIPDLPPGPIGDVTPCTLPWDKSSLSVDGWCQNDSVYFTITNTGDPIDGDMECWAPVRIYIDGVLTQLDSIQLQGGQTITYVFAGNGWTWRLEADQHPLHPGNSHPNAVVEFCGDSLNWTPGGVTAQYQDDADPVVDIYCGIVTGSYDPNDKTGYPTGVGVDHYIYPNQQLQYMIRFQNTGNDTAFTVVIRDTLDTHLNIFTVTPGVASHPYTFQMYGPRVLEWTFENILLPDSNVNEPASHGFVTFTVDQNTNLPFGTQIRNEADIYFDFNAPVTTNQTVHTLYDFSPVITALQPIESWDELITVYPNPTSSEVTITFPELQENVEFIVMDMLGQKIYSTNLSQGESLYRMSVEGYPQGLYFVVINASKKISISKLIVNG